MTESRTVNSIKNVKTGAFVQLFNKILAFIVRTVFIKVLNTEYLGVNGLFVNILTVLSFTELGIGTAIIFSMYKPVAKNDKEKIKSLMQLYKKSYTIIGIIILSLGLCLLPFLNIIIKDVPNIKENIGLIYVLLLINTSISYFYSYKKSIIYAHQKQSVINNIDSIYYLFKSIFEVIFLILTKNFIIYLIIQIIGTLIENIIVSIKADKMYPYLKEKNIKKIPSSESKDIFNDVKSLFIYTIGGGLMNGIDNILISVLINVSTVGLCSNYNLVINSVKSIVSYAINGINASVGNLNASDNIEKKEQIFHQLTFINYIVYSFCGIAFIVLLNSFIKLWLGDKYVLALSVSIAMSMNFFLEGLRNPGYVYRTTLGLFKKGKLTPCIGAMANLILSIILCKYYGITGIFIATALAQLVSFCWIDPFLIYKYEFNKTPVKYYLKYIKYILTFMIISAITLSISNLLNYSIISFIIRIFIVIVIPNILNILIYKNTIEFNELKHKFISMIKTERS